MSDSQKSGELAQSSNGGLSLRGESIAAQAPADDKAPIGYIARHTSDGYLSREFAKPGECYPLADKWEWVPVYAEAQPAPKFKVGDTVRGKGGCEPRKVLGCHTGYTVTRTGGQLGAIDLKEEDLEEYDPRS